MCISHALVNLDSTGTRSLDYRILVRKWIISTVDSAARLHDCVVNNGERDAYEAMWKQSCSWRSGTKSASKNNFWVALGINIFAKLIEELCENGYHHTVSQCRIKIKAFKKTM